MLFIRNSCISREGYEPHINTKTFVSGNHRMGIRSFKAFMMFGILFASFLVFPSSYGQSEIALSLDKRVYFVEESVVIQGLVKVHNNIPAIVQVWNPNNEACSFQQVSVNDNGSFTAGPVLLSGRVCGVAGAYTVKVFYGEFEGSTTFEVQMPATGAKNANGRLQILVDILNKAKQNVDDKIADIKNKGIEIPDDISVIYEDGVSELELTEESAKADDAESTNEHARNAMKAFREVFAELIVLEQLKTETAVADQPVQEDLEKAEAISRLQHAIARAVEFKNKLMGIAANSDSSNLGTASTDFDKAIAEATEFTESGDVDTAANSLAKATQILDDIRRLLTENAQKQRFDKAKEFVTRTVERLDRMIAEAEAMNLPQGVIAALEEAKQKMLNAKTVEEILDISREFQGKNKELFEYKGQNFDKLLEHLKSKLAETKSKAEEMGLDLNALDRIQSLIDEAVAKWQSGETQSALITLERSAEMLREVYGMLNHMNDKLQELDELQDLAEAMKGKYQNNQEALNAIEKALRLIAGAKETLQSAMSKKDFRIAEDMAQQAKQIIERVKNA